MVGLLAFGLFFAGFLVMVLIGVGTATAWIGYKFFSNASDSTIATVAAGWLPIVVFITIALAIFLEPGNEGLSGPEAQGFVILGLGLTGMIAIGWPLTFKTAFSELERWRL